jgi:hypothetical protein
MLTAGAGTGSLQTALRKPPGGGVRDLDMEIWSCIVVLGVIALPLPYVLRFDHGHSMTAMLLVLTLGTMSFYTSRATIAATMVFLALLGDYRRYVSHFEGYPLSDPLLLVAPAVSVLLLIQATMRGRLSMPTTLARLVLALSVLMFIEIFNPMQGGLQIGLAGALFYLAPLLWFWVGRSFASYELAAAFTFRVVIVIGTAAALLGLFQTYFGLLPFEQEWVEQNGYGALFISDEIVRAIGFFSSSAEYQRYLLAAAVTLLAIWLTDRSRLIVLLPLLLMAVFLAAARGPVVMFLAAAAVVWAISARSTTAWAPRLGIATLVAVCLLVAMLAYLQTSSFGGRVAPLVARQVEGLLDPANQEKSTATGHLQMITDGLVAGVTAPAGSGLGATTLAAQKYGARTLNAEVDLPNLMISVGLLGGVLYMAIIVNVLNKALRWWRIERRPFALVMVGVLVATAGGWLIGGEYSMAALIWFLIGVMDRLSRDGDVARRGSRARAPGAHHT